jgi:hypothetical protein
MLYCFYNYIQKKLYLYLKKYSFSENSCNKNPAINQRYAVKELKRIMLTAKSMENRYSFQQIENYKTQEIKKLSGILS